MSNAIFRVDAKDFISGVTKDFEKLKHVAHMGVREGCIHAGLVFRHNVILAAPVLKRRNIWGTWKNGARSRNRYPLVAGELRKSIYFTFSKKMSDIPNGYIRYIVGLPYSNDSWVPGWYGHIVNSGYTDGGLVNFWVRLERGRKSGGEPGKGNTQKFPLRKGSLPWNTKVKPSWRPWEMKPKTAGFVGRGHNAGKGMAEQLLRTKTDSKIKQLLGRI